MSIFEKIASLFKSESDFLQDLKRKFGEDSAPLVLEAFDKINLPVPTKSNQYLKSNEGSLVFVNKYGVVVRVEPQNPAKNYYVRVNDSGCILQPIGSIDAGTAVIEICPGCNVEKDEDSIEFMKALLECEGLIFSDPQLENLGRLYTDSTRYPDGILVILDRLAVSTKKENINIVKNKVSEEAKKEQKRFTAPFRDAFKEGLADKSKMRRFWELLENYASQGKIKRGWNDNSDFFDKIDYLSKTSRAEEVAKYYSRILEKYEKKNAKQ